MIFGFAWSCAPTPPRVMIPMLFPSYPLKWPSRVSPVHVGLDANTGQGMCHMEAHGGLCLRSRAYALGRGADGILP